MALKTKYLIVARVENGKFKPREGYNFKELISFWEGLDLKITFEPLYLKANKKQFGYLYGYIYPTIRDHIVESTGNFEITVDDVDKAFKEMFALVEEVNIITGEVCKRVIDKKEFDKMDLTEYITKIRDHCLNEMSLNLSSSEDYYSLN